MTLGRYTELSHLADSAAGAEAVWTAISDRKSTYRVLPDGRCDIILRFMTRLKPISELTIIVTGPTTTYYDVSLEPGMGFVGVRLRPGYLQKILGLEPVPLRDRTLIGHAAVDACPDLRALCTPAADQGALVDRLVRFIHKRHAESACEVARLGLNIISALHASGGRLRIADIAGMHGICERTVRRILHRATGLSPKAFASVLQFCWRGHG